ncbi:hypothetical protein GOL95_32715 [Sinorhizobium medicae]|nr:hypothetical protein [Sinorhizobium medicae]MDX1244594.1 hypothetical protein [Sinorhizobium medicae]
MNHMRLQDGSNRAFLALRPVSTPTGDAGIIAPDDLARRVILDHGFAIHEVSKGSRPLAMLRNGLPSIGQPRHMGIGPGGPTVREMSIGFRKKMSR